MIHLLGLSQWYPFCSTQMSEALQIIQSDILEGLPEDVMLLEKIKWIAESVFAQQTTSLQDHNLVKNLATHIMKEVVFNTLGMLNYCGYEIPLPPPETGTCYYHAVRIS